MTLPEPQPGLIVAGKYRLEGPLAGGGMGSVWRARHGSLDVAVAVKFMAPSLTTVRDSRARFEREAKAAARLKSPYVVQVLDYGVDRGLPYIVMELLDGEDLHARLTRVERLSLADTARIALPVTKALTLAHDAGIIHRDLKPRNIFLARVGDEEIVKILDFGIAKRQSVEGADAVEGDDGTASGTLLGSPHHMSPEQARGDKVDHRSDLWSLAVVVYSALTGTRPFTGRTVGDVIARICVDPLPRPSQVRPELSPELDAFFERAFARNPDHRFQSAREFGAAFAALAGAVAAPVRPAEPVWAPELVPRSEPTQPLAAEGTFGASSIASVAPPRRRSQRLKLWLGGTALVLAAGAATAWAWRFRPSTQTAAPASSAPLFAAKPPAHVAPPPSASAEPVSSSAASTPKISSKPRHRRVVRAPRKAPPHDKAPRTDPDFGLSVGN